MATDKGEQQFNEVFTPAVRKQFAKAARKFGKSLVNAAGVMEVGTGMEVIEALLPAAMDKLQFDGEMEKILEVTQV